MSEDNIREFHIPEKPRAKGDNIRTSLAKAKKYDDLQAVIAKDLVSLEQARDEVQNDKTFILGYNKGHKAGALEVYDAAIYLLKNYLEQYTHESS